MQKALTQFNSKRTVVQRTHPHTDTHAGQHTRTHTFPAQRGSSQKFKAPAESILSPTACTSKDVRVSGTLFTMNTDRPRLVWCYHQVLRLEKNLGQECFIWAGQITAGDMAPCQEDWEVSSLDLRKPDKPSCPVLNSGLALSWETLASHDSWDQGVMSAETSCLILRIALLMALHRRRSQSTISAQK